MAPAVVIIRRAIAADAAAIAALIGMGRAVDPLDRAAAAAEAAHPAYGAAFARVAASSDTHLFVAEVGGRIVGTYQLTVMPGIWQRGRVRGKIESVMVDPDLRGRGVGGAMMRHAVDQARGLGVGLLELSSNKARLDAHRFYRQLGFAQSHEAFKMEL